MSSNEFQQSVKDNGPPTGISVPLTALWWDAKGNWSLAHDLVNELGTQEGMAVHAYLHRKEGDSSNAEYWYKRCGREFYREALDEEWHALVEGLISRPESA